MQKTVLMEAASILWNEKENFMAKKIIAVNAGPRKGWNTDTLIKEAVKGAEEAGATVDRVL